MAYTMAEWTALSASEKRVAVEGLAKSHNLKLGSFVTLDKRRIGTTASHGVVIDIKPNTSWDTGVENADDVRRYPDIATNMLVTVETDEGAVIEVNWLEITKVVNK